MASSFVVAGRHVMSAARSVSYAWSAVAVVWYVVARSVQCWLGEEAKERRRMQCSDLQWVGGHAVVFSGVAWQLQSLAFFVACLRARSLTQHTSPLSPCIHVPDRKSVV